MKRLIINRASQNVYNLYRKDYNTIYVCTDTHNIYFRLDLIFQEDEFKFLTIKDTYITITVYGPEGTNSASIVDYSDSTVETAVQTILTLDDKSFKFVGDLLKSEIVPSLLVSSNFGNVYNVIESFEVGNDSGQVSSSLFVPDAAGNRYPGGTNIVVVNSGGTEKFDILSESVIDPSYYNIKSDWDSAAGTPSEILNKPSLKSGSGIGSIIENDLTNNTASGDYSYASGTGTQTTNRSEHSEGQYNLSHTGQNDSEKTIHSIGIGTADNSRSNALEVMKSGDIFIKGVGGYSGIGINNVQSLQDVINKPFNIGLDWEEF